MTEITPTPTVTGIEALRGLTMILEGTVPHLTYTLTAIREVRYDIFSKCFYPLHCHIQCFHLPATGAPDLLPAAVLPPSQPSWDFPVLHGLVSVLLCVVALACFCLPVAPNHVFIAPRSGDWPCPNCHNVNWAKRDTCNMCNTPRLNLLKSEGPREGRGGGYMEREEVAKKQFNDEEEEYDEFGRKKKKSAATRPYYGH